MSSSKNLWDKWNLVQVFAVLFFAASVTSAASTKAKDDVIVEVPELGFIKGKTEDIQRHLYLKKVCFSFILSLCWDGESSGKNLN